MIVVGILDRKRERMCGLVCELFVMYAAEVWRYTRWDGGGLDSKFGRSVIILPQMPPQPLRRCGGGGLIRAVGRISQLLLRHNGSQPPEQL